MDASFEQLVATLKEMSIGPNSGLVYQKLYVQRLRAGFHVYDPVRRVESAFKDTRKAAQFLLHRGKEISASSL